MLGIVTFAIGYDHQKSFRQGMSTPLARVGKPVRDFAGRRRGRRGRGHSPMWMAGLVNMLSPSSGSPRCDPATPSSTNEKAPAEAAVPDLQVLQGNWDHTLVPTGVSVDGKKVRIGNRIFDLEFSDTHLEVAGWTLEKYAEDELRWQEKDSKQRCTWTRQKIGLKRERKLSDRGAAAERDNELVARWMTSPLMRRAAPPRGRVPRAHVRLWR